MIKSRLVLLVTGTLLAVACSKMTAPGSSSTGGGGPTKHDPNAPVAKVGGEAITTAELDKATKGQVQRAEAEQAEKVHQIQEQALDNLVEEKLIAKKAKAENLTPEKLIDREVNSKVSEPSDTEIHGLYDSTKAQGQQLPPFEQVKDQIVKYLKQRNSAQAKKTFIDKLRADNKVEILLPPVLLPKQEVALEGESRGPNNAPVNIVEFSDYQCPFCSRAEDTVKKVMEDYKGKVRLFYRDYPLPFHDKAQKASEAALCAADQGKYWEMHEKLFANQQALSVDQLKTHAKGLGLDSGKFDKCLDGGDKAKDVEKSKKAGEELGVQGTPHFFINGRPLSGAQPYEKFKELIDLELRGT